MCHDIGWHLKPYKHVLIALVSTGKKITTGGAHLANMAQMGWGDGQTLPGRAPEANIKMVILKWERRLSAMAVALGCVGQ